MEITGNNYDGWLCRKCGRTIGLERSVTREYIRKVESDVRQRISDYRNLESRLVIDIRNDHNVSKLFQECFNKYEIEASKSLFHKSKYYFMGHYDASKKSKRRWCSLSSKDILAIEIDDPNYKKLIKDLLYS